MADTSQGVSWALQRACALRTGEDWASINTTSKTLSRLQSCSERIEDAEIVDGIWVTSMTCGGDADDQLVFIPSSGLRVEEIARPFGGWDTVRKLCRGCEANVSRQPDREIAGCHGWFDVRFPYSEELDDLLRESIEDLGLGKQLQQSFIVTKPLWFGFWIDSPLKPEQAEFLLELLPKALPRLWGEERGGGMFDRGQFVMPDFDPSEYYGRQYGHFIRALSASIHWNLPLRVETAPPGHTDFGFWTTFAHCPRCKAQARIEKWKQVGSQRYQCDVCRFEFDPAETTKSEEMDCEFEHDSLEKELGDSYDDFVFRFADHKGYSRKQMEEALDEYRDGPNKRRVVASRHLQDSLTQEHSASQVREPASRLRRELFLELSEGVVLELVLINAGDFVMGTPDDDELEGCIDHLHERPAHKVHIERPFYIGRFPITQAQWLAVTDENPSYCRGDLRRPAEQVTWYDAQEFCVWLSEQLGRHIQLPSEAQWEYACRAGTTTAYWFGDTVTDEDANCDTSIKSPLDAIGRKCERRETTPVDQFPPNPWGLYDMTGNVLEWCDDNWHDSYVGAPVDGTSWLDQPESVQHVARGGAAYQIAAAVRSAARMSARANAGSRPVPEEFELLDFEFFEYYGLRVISFPIKDDLVENES